jgi:hypothetical protein
MGSIVTPEQQQEMLEMAKSYPNLRGLTVEELMEALEALGFVDKVTE